MIRGDISAKTPCLVASVNAVIGGQNIVRVQGNCPEVSLLLVALNRVINPSVSGVHAGNLPQHPQPGRETMMDVKEQDNSPSVRWLCGVCGEGNSGVQSRCFACNAERQDNSLAETETWRVGLEEGYYLEAPDGRRWGLNNVYGRPQDLPAAILDARAKAGRVRELEAIRAAALNLLAGGNGVGEDAMGELFIHDEGRLLDHLCLLAEALLAPIPTEGSGS